jgi:hypothetical protein
MLSDFGTEVPGELCMSNHLPMATIQSIETLHRAGHSNREIARILGIDRGAVNKYVQRLRAAEAPPSLPDPATADSQNRPNPRTGSAGEVPTDGSQNQPNLHNPLTGQETSGCRPSFPGRTGPKSLCEQYRAVITSKLDQGLSSVRIHQDLRSEYSFPGSYHSVRRFIEHLGVKKPLPFRRMEVEPGHEAQIDFGTAAFVIDANGKKRRPWMFRIVLSQSRKACSEVVWRKHTSEELEQACSTDVSYGACRLRSIRNLLERPATQSQQALSFIEEHPIIRPLSDYPVDSLNAFRKERNHERES